MKRKTGFDGVASKTETAGLTPSSERSLVPSETQTKLCLSLTPSCCLYFISSLPTLNYSHGYSIIVPTS